MAYYEYLKEEGGHKICHIRDSFYSILQGIDVFHRWEVWLEVAVCVASMMECLRKSTLALGGMDCFTGFGSLKSGLFLMEENL